MRDGLRCGVQVAIAAIEGVVGFPSVGVGGDGLAGPRPIGFRWDFSDADGRHQRVPVAGSDGLFWHVLFSTGDIADDLSPETAFGSAPHGDEPVDWGEVAVEELEDLPDAETDAFVHGAEQVATLVLQGQGPQ